MNRKKTLLVSGVITVVLVALLLSMVDLSNFLYVIQKASLPLILVGFAMYLLNALFRSARYFVIFQKKIQLKLLFKIVAIQTMMINLIPNVLGEFSFIYLIKKHTDHNSGHGLVTLVMGRLLDLLAIFTLFVVFAFFIPDIPNFMISAIWIFAFFVFLLIICMLMTLFFQERFTNLIHRTFATLHLSNFRSIKFLLEKLDEIVKALDYLKSAKTLFIAYILSLGTWMISFTMSWVLLVASGYDFNFIIIVFGVIFSKLMSALPIYGLAGFGTVESFWTLGFMALGIDKMSAIVTGFSLHVITLVFALLLGLIGFLGLKK